MWEKNALRRLGVENVFRKITKKKYVSWRSFKKIYMQKSNVSRFVGQNMPFEGLWEKDGLKRFVREIRPPEDD